MITVTLSSQVAAKSRIMEGMLFVSVESLYLVSTSQSTRKVSTVA